MAHGVKRIPSCIFEKPMMTVQKSIPEENSRLNDYYLALEEAIYDLIHSQDVQYCKSLMKAVYDRKIILNKFKSQYADIQTCSEISGRISIDHNEWKLKLKIVKSIHPTNYAYIYVTKNDIKGSFDARLNAWASIYQKLLVEICSNED